MSDILAAIFVFAVILGTFVLLAYFERLRTGTDI